MYRKTMYALVLGFVLIGCNSSIGNSNTHGTTSSSNSSVEVNLTQAIANGDIANYDASRNGTSQVYLNYVAVINYLRSLSITCNDPTAITGPSNPDMVWNTYIAASAKEHSEDMRKSDWYSHDGSGTVNDTTAQDMGLGRGSHFNERIIHNGFSASTSAENIAMSTASFVRPDDYWLKVMEGWMASTHGHCSNIMNPQLTEFGMYESRAAVDSNGTYKIYWTQDFGGN